MIDARDEIVNKQKYIYCMYCGKKNKKDIKKQYNVIYDSPNIKTEAVNNRYWVCVHCGAVNYG